MSENYADKDLETKLREAVWAARALFERSKTSGTTANISFLHDGQIYISCSGSCFGTLTEADFVKVPLKDVTAVSADDGKKPSKELPLHRMLYQADLSIQAVLHAHSPYATLWSCLDHPDKRNVVPAYTPYLGMKLGKVVSVPYGKPGSPELFAAFKACLGKEHGYLLSKHGPVVGGKSMLNAFEALEELEQSSFIAWELKLGQVEGVTEV